MIAVATAYLVHGYLGSGKTTYAKEIAREHGAIYLGMDEWYLRLFTDGSPTAHLDDALLGRLWIVLNGHWPQILSAGVDVVLDFGYWTRARRDEARSLARAVGGGVELHWVQADDETAKLRSMTRQSDTAFVIDSEAYEHLKLRFEPLAADEHYLGVNGLAIRSRITGYP
jgi:predicted kinase